MPPDRRIQHMLKEQQSDRTAQRRTQDPQHTNEQLATPRRAAVWWDRIVAAGSSAAQQPWLVALAQLSVLLIMIAALLWPTFWHSTALPGGFDGSDLRISHWTSALVIKQSVAQTGRLPLWNDVFGGGRPLAADPLAALWYPPTQLVHFFDVRDYLLLLLVGHLLFAGAGIIVLGQRALDLSPGAALVAALAFVATPRYIAHLGAGHVTMVQTVAWFPWVALGAWATVRHPARWAVPFAFCLALMLLAGHPQLAYYGGLMVTAVSAWLLAQRWRAHGWRAALQSASGLGAAGGLAIMLAGAYLVPLAEFTAHSTRQRSVASTDATALWDFLQALVGYRQTSEVPHEALFDPGLGVLALAALGVAARWRRGVPLLGAVVLVAALAMGTSSPVYRVAATVLPSLDVFRGLARIWFVGLVGIALLAGLGAHALFQALNGQRRPAILLASVGGGALLMLSLLQASRPFTRIVDVSGATTPNVVEQTALDVAGTHRIYGLQRNVHQEVAAAHGARLAHGWDPLLVEPYVTFMARAGGYSFSGYPLSVPPYEIYDPGYPTSQDAQPNAALLGMFDVEAVASSTQLHDPRFHFVSNVGGVNIYRNTANNGAAYMVAARGDAPPTVDTLQRVGATVDVVEQQRERLHVRVAGSAGGWLVIGSPVFPGWVAQIDGHTVPVERVDGVVPALRVTPGTHDVVYAYHPRSVQLGGTLTILGLAASGAWLVGLRLARRRAQRRNKLVVPSTPAAA